MNFGLSDEQKMIQAIIRDFAKNEVEPLAGMQSSDSIVAINKNADALIFKLADYSIAGDLYKVIPVLMEQLASKKPIVCPV